MRFTKSLCTYGVAFLVTAVAVFATIDATLQMQLGNPAGATADPTNHTHYLIQRPQYSLDYSDTTREPNWVSWDLTTADVGGSGRAPDFYQDTTLPAGFYQVKNTDYSGSGYDRGHMCPSADRTVTATDNIQVFYMSNMIPQSPDNNQGVWASFETYCRTLAAAGNELLITCGPSGFAGSTIASGVAIPGYTWKIAVVVPVGSGTALSRIDANTRVIAIKIPNIAGVRSDPWQKYITSAAQIQTDTGFTFFSALSAPVAAALRAKVDGLTAVGSPAITTQPVGQSSPVGGSANFTVAASGNATLTYQWAKDGVDIVGATSTTLSLTNIQLADAGTYTVVAANSLGSATSSGAVLAISGVAPSIVTSPVTKSVAAGSTTTFTVAASGSATLTYQWRLAGVNLANGTGVSGAASATLTLANIQAATAGSYDVVVTNSVSSATSAAAVLSVTPAAPTIVTTPTAQTAALGSTANFTVVATGTAPLTYQWRKAGTAIVGNATATTTTLTLTGIAAGDAASYDVVVSNSVSPAATSTAVALTIGSSAPGGTYSYSGGTYTQDFNTLPSTGTFTFVGNGPFGFTDAQPNGVGATGMTGWSFAKYSGSGANALFKVDDGTLTSGSIYSYGTGTSTDRALGTVASGTTVSRFGITLINTTGQTITQFALGYTGEQWRDGGNTTNVAQTLSFSYSVGASDINTGTFTPATALDFVSPVFTKTAGALDGNAAANRTVIAPVTITGLSWAPNQTLVLLWTDINDTGNDHGFAVDDLTFTTPVAGVPVAPSVQTTTPANSATSVPGNTAITVTFDAPVTITGSWFTISSAFNGPVAAAVTGGPKTFTLSPPLNFLDNDTVTVSILAAQIVDQASGTLHPAANTTFSFTTAAAVGPTITTQPASQTLSAGATATFTVAASGTAPFGYAWRKDGTAITGNASAATATLTLANVQATDAGSYTVVVSNGVSPNATSAAATLTVTPVAPVIATQPASQTVSAGAGATFTVAATGSNPMTYQWRKGGVNLVDGTGIAGSTTATLALTNLAVADSGNYDVVVSNGVSPAATSAVAVLLVNPAASAPQVNYAGGTYTQNFDTLPSAGTFTFSGNGPFPLVGATPPAGVGATGLTGWTFINYGGTGTSALFKIDDGTSNAGGIYSYGTASSTDRALGSLASASQVGRFGVTFVNTTSATITQFTLGYTGEQWRNGGNTSPQTLSFSYLVGATDINTGTFIAATALDFTSPNVAATAAALDGNFAANRTVIAPVTITGLSWGAGQTLTLRWTDLNDIGSDHGLAIDDLSFTTPAASAQTAQTITFTQPAAHLTTDAPFTLGATASSGLTVTFTVDSGPATVSGSTLTLTGTAGSVVVRASQAGNTSYFAATDVTRTIAVTVPAPVFSSQPANQTVIAGQNVMFTAASSGSPSFQWQVSTDSGSTWTNLANDTTYSGVTTGTLTVTAPALVKNGYRYRATATNAGGAVNSSVALLTVNGIPGRLVNLSIRTTAGAGSSTLIVGFVASGGTQNASLLVRAAGPALLPFGVTGVLANPALTINNASNQVVTSNDDWSSSLAPTFASVGAFSWTSGSADAAISPNLAPAPYTAVVTGPGATTGIALAEIYDLNTAYSVSNPQLVNVSARAQVGTDVNIMIAGFVITGDTSQTLLIRAVGPKLAFYGVTGVLADPQLAIFNKGGTQIATNDNWDSSLAATFTQLGAFPLDASSKDAALLITLAPGVYTAQVSGVGNTTGVALVEIYAVP